MDASLTGCVRTDLRNTVRALREAKSSYLVLESGGVQFERSTGKDHLTEWMRAIADFQRAAGLAGS